MAPRHSIGIGASAGMKAAQQLSKANGYSEVEDDEGTGLEDDGGLGSDCFRTLAVAGSMPVRSNIRMGSSVPVNIPMHIQIKNMSASPAAQPGGEYVDPPTGSTFVPPHELSQSMATTQGFAFSLATGESLASMKRDRLRARNAILKSTGFLEEGSERALPTHLPGASADVHVDRTFVAGGLSKALRPIQ
eukprot:gene24880-10545_t